MQNFKINREVQVKETVTITLSVEAAQELRALFGNSCNSKYLRDEFEELNDALYTREDAIWFTKTKAFDFIDTDKIHE